jgi:hypothetical protein
MPAKNVSQLVPLTSDVRKAPTALIFAGNVGDIDFVEEAKIYCVCAAAN